MEFTAKTIYSNGMYSVRTRDEGFGYEIYNIGTDTVEGITEKLPSAINQCDVARSLMEEIIERCPE